LLPYKQYVNVSYCNKEKKCLTELILMQNVEMIGAENRLLHPRKNSRYEGIAIHEVTTFNFPL